LDSCGLLFFVCEAYGHLSEHAGFTYYLV